MKSLLFEKHWIPACAGMTVYLDSRRSLPSNDGIGGGNDGAL